MYGRLRLAFPTGTSFRYVKDTGPGKICGDAIGISRHIGEAVAVQGEAEQDVGIVIVKFRAKGAATRTSEFPALNHKLKLALASPSRK